MQYAYSCLLSEVPPGEAVTITGVKGSQHLRSRLAALGITPGTHVEVCAGCPDRVRVRGAVLVLDTHMRTCVECSPLSGSTRGTKKQRCDDCPHPQGSPYCNLDQKKP